MNPSPRTITDDRFYTPRAQASTARSISSFGTPRSSLPLNSARSTLESSSSEGTYATPRGSISGVGGYPPLPVQVHGGLPNHLPPRGYTFSAAPSPAWGMPPPGPGIPLHPAGQHGYHTQQQAMMDGYHPNQRRHSNPALTKDRLQQHQYQLQNQRQQYQQERQFGIPPLHQQQYKQQRQDHRQQHNQQNYQQQYNNNTNSTSRNYDQNDVQDLFSFTRHGRGEDVENLLERRGIPIDIEDDNGNTILAVACQNGSKKLVKLALRRGADINSCNHRGNTPLMFCFKYGHDALGEYLMSKGADESMENSDGETCLDMKCS